MTWARVIKLPQVVASQIAAGEAVARPASVVKELLENSIDAGASSVRVELDGGGTARVMVVDDGCGFHPDDVLLAFERHATSKITTADDLFRLETLGFRGEALPSIAAVSRTRLRTRRPEDSEGIELRIAGGSAPELLPAGCAPGTSVQVEDLFFNVPARRKFLRAVSTEAQHVTDTVRATALAHPSLSVELYRDGRRRHTWLSAPSREERVRSILSDYALMRAAAHRGPLIVEGYLSTPSQARHGSGGLWLFVNRRAVQDRALARAVAAAYGDRLERGRFPVGALFLELPADLVDVNVHPQKGEVRFSNARAVTDAVYSVVSAALATMEGARAPEAPGRADGSATAWRPYAHPAPFDDSAAPWKWADSAGSSSPDGSSRAGGSSHDGSSRAGGSSHDGSWRAPGSSPGREARLDGGASATGARVVGIALGRYLVCERADAVVLVDLVGARAADLERRVERELSRGPLGAERLLFPVVRELDREQLVRAALWTPTFERLGLDVRPSGELSLTLYTTPRLLRPTPAETIFDELVVISSRVPGNGDDPPRRELITRLCLRAAQAAPRADEAIAAALAAADDPAAGRVVAALSSRELDNRSRR